MKSPVECTACGSHGAWAVHPQRPHRFCKCGALGPGPAPNQRYLYRYLVESVMMREEAEERCTRARDLLDNCTDGGAIDEGGEAKAREAAQILADVPGEAAALLRKTALLLAGDVK